MLLPADVLRAGVFRLHEIVRDERVGLLGTIIVQLSKIFSDCLTGDFLLGHRQLGAFNELRASVLGKGIEAATGHSLTRIRLGLLEDVRLLEIVPLHADLLHRGDVGLKSHILTDNTRPLLMGKVDQRCGVLGLLLS